MKKMKYVKKRKDEAFGSNLHELAWHLLKVGDICDVKTVVNYGIEQEIIYNKNDVPLCTTDSPIGQECFEEVK